MTILVCGDRTIDLRTPQVMGVLNITPDSFSDGGRFFVGGALDLGAVEREARTMVAAGAVCLDIGGESTRPGAEPVSQQAEFDRVMPVLERLNGIDTTLSVDTRRAAVAREALSRGAHLINDVSGFSDPAMIDAARASSAAVCIMHMQGEPQTMQRDPHYADVTATVSAFLKDRVDACVRAGIDKTRILVDPGFGFGKSLQHNLQLLRDLSQLAKLGCPILVGLSRKRMIGALTGRDVDARLPGGIALAVVAVLRGARLVRTHDVAATVDALKVVSAVEEVRDGP